MYNLTKCALCGNETELELSHTVPKMAIRTLKKTAIGNIRSTENPNKTIQDTLTNMLGVILVTLYHKGQREVWNNTEILNGVGRIEVKEQQIQSVFGNELIHIMETAKKASEAMSVAQQKKAEDRIKTAGEDVKNYSVFKDWMNDMDLKNRIIDK